MKALNAYMFLLAAVILFSCKKSRSSLPPEVTNTVTLPANGQAVVTANDAFAFKMMQTTLQNDVSPSNKLVSPLSIYLALSMVYNGADGPTQDSIAQTLQLAGLDINTLNATCQALLQQLPEEDSRVMISIANSIWYADGKIEPVPAFLTTNTNYYDAALKPVDFASTATISTINDWVSSKTNGKIPTIVSALPASTLMVLLNAIYFKGSWQSAFKTSDTYNDQFYTGTGAVNVPFMKQTMNLSVYTNPNFTMAELPYGGGKSFSMYIVEPVNNNQPINQFAATLDAAGVKAAIAGMYKVAGVNIIVPKWQYTYSIDDMKPELSALGMGIAFGDGANFSKMYNTGVYISQAVHKAFIEVDESGTTAAAVTGIVISPTFVEQGETIKFDHPFVYVIAEKQTGTILFTGILNNPSQH